MKESQKLHLKCDLYDFLISLTCCEKSILIRDIDQWMEKAEKALHEIELLIAE